MLDRVVLHIGLAKTGTKTLQAAMTLNRDLLRRHGFVYPALPGERHAGLAVYAAEEKADPGLPAHLGLGESDRLVRFIDEFPSGLAAAVAGPDIHSAILSNEYCSTGLSTVGHIARVPRHLMPLAHDIFLVGF